MKKIIIFIVILAIVGLGAYYFIVNNSSNAVPNYTTPAVTNTYENTTPSAQSPVPALPAPSTPTPSPAETQPAPQPAIDSTTSSPVVITPPPATQSIPPQPTMPPAPVSDVTVDIKNFSFSPSTLTIKKGTKVTWTNNDRVVHTVTSTTGSLLDSPNLAPGQSFSFTFTNLGTEKYFCNIHPSMNAEVVITN